MNLIKKNHLACGRLTHENDQFIPIEDVLSELISTNAKNGTSSNSTILVHLLSERSVRKQNDSLSSSNDTSFKPLAFLNNKIRRIVIGNQIISLIMFSL